MGGWGADKRSWNRAGAEKEIPNERIARLHEKSRRTSISEAQEGSKRKAAASGRRPRGGGSGEDVRAPAPWLSRPPFSYTTQVRAQPLRRGGCLSSPSTRRLFLLPPLPLHSAKSQNGPRAPTQTGNGGASASDRAFPTKTVFFFFPPPYLESDAPKGLSVGGNIEKHVRVRHSLGKRTA